MDDGRKWWVPWGLVLGLTCGCVKVPTVPGVPEPSTLVPTTANGSTFVLSCGAVWPSIANGSTVTVACSNPMDLSPLDIANGSTFYVCANPSHLPPIFSASTVNLISASVCSNSASCSGPVFATGTVNGGSATYGCGSTLPNTLNGASITITCAATTDLSAIQNVNSSKITMCSVPCKLPHVFNASQIIVDAGVCIP